MCIPAATCFAVLQASVRLTGPDQPGLLMKLTEMLASHGLNVEHIQVWIGYIIILLPFT